jgi:hypothetical protein
MIRVFIRNYIGLLVTILSLSALATTSSPYVSDRVGIFDFDQIRIQGGMGGSSYSKAQFNLLNSYLGMSWQLAPHFLGYFEFGDLQYQKDLVWINSLGYTDFGIRRAFLEYQSSSIGIRMGVMENALETESPRAVRSHLIPTQAYQLGLWKKQVTGLELFWSYQSWKSQLQVFRATDYGDTRESTPWLSGSFYYLPPNALGVGLAAQSGELEGNQINVPSLNALGINSLLQESSRLRIGKVGLYQNSEGSEYWLEWSKGEVNQKNQNHSFASTVLDVRHRISNTYAFYLRFDQWSPDVTISDLDNTRRDIGIIIQSPPGKWMIIARENLPGLQSPIKKSTEAWVHFLLTSY